MRNYELVCILQPDLEDTAFKEAGGTVDKEDIWGKRKLAYLIRKQSEGQYVLLNIAMPADTTKELERNIRFLEPVMRYMLTVVL